MRHKLIAASLALIMGGWLASAASAAECQDPLQQNKSQQKAADEAQVRGDLAAGSQCADAADKATSEKKNEEAAERAKRNSDEKPGTTGQGGKK